MSESTKIEWAHHTWSPWRGCEKVSDGCKHCYAETMSKRNPAVLGEWGRNGKRVVNADWRKPLAWNRAAKKAGEPRRVFPSLCDPFEDREELDNTRARFFCLIDRTPYLDWLLLTKRPENVIDQWAFNVWLGVSVENQALADERIPRLLNISAAVRWLSVEPLLGPVNLCDCGSEITPVGWHRDSCRLKQIDWVVVGGESGPNARPCQTRWVRSILEQCRKAGVACFVKQLGRDPIHDPDGPLFPYGTRFDPDAGRILLRDRKGGDPAEWPPSLRVREFPAARPITYFNRDI